MAIESEYTLQNSEGKIIHIRGDHHAESGTDLGEVKDLFSDIQDVLSSGGNAFIEFGEFQLGRLLASEDKGINNGMYYRIPFLLSELSDKSGVCINDIRACKVSAQIGRAHV